MRQTVAVMTLAAMLGGCVNYTASKATAIAGGVFGVGGVATIAAGAKLNAPGVMGVGLAATLTGLFLGIGGIRGMSRHESPSQRAAREREVESQRQAEAVAARNRLKERAWRITQAAAMAAREGDCSRTLEADRAVHDIDPDLHAKVFVRDVAIKRCLDAAASRQPVPAVAPSP